MTAEMKKVAFVTSYYVNNYGTFLQTYATQEMLRKLGCTPELISVKRFWGEIKAKRRRYFLRQALTSSMGIQKSGIFFSRIVKRIGLGSYAKGAQKRENVFEDFREEKLQFSPIYNTVKELHDSIMERYEAVIVGSDQLWLPGNVVGDYFTLSFVPDGVNRISYSTSFGQKNIPKELKDQIRHFITRINYLSVREKSGQKIINDITGRRSQVVLDPVLLFDRDYWEGQFDNTPIIKGEYIFCYILGKKKCGRKFAHALKSKYNYRIVNLPNLDEYIWNDDKYSDISLYDANPFDFLNLIFNAKYVITDSFHCTAFSILFHKTFFVFHRHNDKSKYSTNDRIDDLLERTGLRNRLVNNGNIQDGSIVDETSFFREADLYIESERRKSISFLENALYKGKLKEVASE